MRRRALLTYFDFLIVWQEEIKKTSKYIVFCDTQNKEIDEEYAESIIVEFRRQTNWKVLPGTPIWEDLRSFSKGYSRIKRDPCEVVAIFRIANGV